jgi:hypothetical protein
VVPVKRPCLGAGIFILWHIDPLLGNNLGSNNDTTAIDRQHCRKYATLLEPLQDSGPCAAVEVLFKAVFAMWSAPRLYRSTDRVQFS